jgi:hypothetical protein
MRCREAPLFSENWVGSGIGSPNEAITLDGIAGIARVVITAPAGGYTLDDLTFQTASVPEPATLALVGLALSGL